MKFAYVIAALVMISSLGGCGYVGRINATYTGFSKMCVEGVSYIQFTSGASVQLDKNGKIVECQ